MARHHNQPAGLRLNPHSEFTSSFVEPGFSAHFPVSNSDMLSRRRVFGP
jgi:hypothetical protein